MPRFDTPQPVTADITLPVGELRLVATDRPETVVTVRPRDSQKSGDVTLAERTVITCTDGRLTVESPPKWWNVIGPSGSIEVTVTLPSGSEVRAECAVGSIHADGRLGRCALRAKVGSVRVEHVGGGTIKADVGGVTIGTSDGPVEVTANVGTIRVAELRAPSTLRSAHGSIAVRASRTQLEATCSSGSIEVDRAEGAVTARTSFGNVRIGSISAGTVNLESSYGELEVGVAEGVPVWLDASSQRGTVRNLLDAAAPPADGESFVELRARTGHGVITVRRSPAWSAWGAPAGRGGPQDDAPQDDEARDELRPQPQDLS